MVMWEQLLALMAELLALHQQILDLGRHKKDLLVLAKPADLENVVKQEELLLIKVGKLDAARKEVIKNLVKHYAANDQTLTLEKLIKFAPDDVAVQLKKSSQDFAVILPLLKSQNELNTKLIQQALNLVNYNINLLAHSAVGPTYSAQGYDGQVPGQSSGQFNRTIFDHKV